MKIVILLGAPGCGKGTMAGRLSASDSLFHHISSGDLLRAALKNQTVSHHEAGVYMKRGELVPDALIAQMIIDYITTLPNGDTLILDGFPRTLIQAEMLEKALPEVGATLTHVVLLDVPEPILIDRIAGRRMCPACGAGYHVVTLQPKVAGVCDKCGTALVTRKDDNPETAKYRLDVYQAQTLPLIAYYEERGLLTQIPAHGMPVADIVEELRRVIS
jgi:adenylate kinase